MSRRPGELLKSNGSNARSGFEEGKENWVALWKLPVNRTCCSDKALDLLWQRIGRGRTGPAASQFLELASIL